MVIERFCEMDFKTKLRKGDEVVVLSGASKGTVGKLEKILDNSRVFVTGAATFKKHQKPDMQNPDGGIVSVLRPIHISNVSFVDPKTKKASRLGFKKEKGSAKARFSKASDSVL